MREPPLMYESCAGVRQAPEDQQAPNSLPHWGADRLSMSYYPLSYAPLASVLAGEVIGIPVRTYPKTTLDGRDLKRKRRRRATPHHECNELTVAGAWPGSGRPKRHGEGSSRRWVPVRAWASECQSRDHVNLCSPDVWRWRLERARSSAMRDATSALLGTWNVPFCGASGASVSTPSAEAGEIGTCARAGASGVSVTRMHTRQSRVCAKRHGCALARRASTTPPRENLAHTARQARVYPRKW